MPVSAGRRPDVALFAEVQVGLETVAGGSVVSMLLAIMYAFLRRTKDTDERRDEASKMIMDAALEREERAWKQHDRVMLERDDARRETERIRVQWERDRMRWENAK